MTSTLRGGGKAKMRCYWTLGEEGGVPSVLDVQSLFYLLKKIGFAMTRHHVESKINI